MSSPTSVAHKDIERMTDVEFARSKYVDDYQKSGEIQQTRRMLEIYNSETLRKAAGQEVLTNSNFFRDKISKYVRNTSKNQSST